MKREQDAKLEPADPVKINCLTGEELTAFRDEFQEKEKEIQRNIGIYLSGLVLVTGWVIGPQTKPVINMALDNYGYNLFGLLIVVALNVIFTCFLIYKSLTVHEITQFVAVHSPSTSVFNSWEAWRRSGLSGTLPVRRAYTIILSILPICVSFAILGPVGYLLFCGDPNALAIQLTQPGAPPAVTGEQLARAFSYVRWGFGVVVALHILPLWFFYENIGPTKWRWDDIHDRLGRKDIYEEIDAIPMCSREAPEAKEVDSKD